MSRQTASQASRLPLTLAQALKGRQQATVEAGKEVKDETMTDEQWISNLRARRQAAANDVIDVDAIPDRDAEEWDVIELD